MSKAFDYHDYLKWDRAPLPVWEEPEDEEEPEDYHQITARERERRVNKRMSEFLDMLEAGDDE